MKRTLLPLLALLLLAATGTVERPEGAVLSSGYARMVGGTSFPPPR